MCYLFSFRLDSNYYKLTEELWHFFSQKYGGGPELLAVSLNGSINSQNNGSKSSSPRTNQSLSSSPSSTPSTPPPPLPHKIDETQL